MAKISRRRKRLAEEIEEEIEESGKKLLYTPVQTKLMISSGSTLVDLAISGGRVRGGGIPGGILVEIYGRSSSGKTAMAMEICGSAQHKNGSAMVLDPESRLDKEYAKTYDAEIPKDNYYRPNTVNEVISKIQEWEPKDTNVINACIVDSIAALSTENEMDTEDKRGQQRAKDLSAGMRKTARIISVPHKLTVFTNQVRAGDYGDVTPGGFAVGFYAMLRMRLQPGKPKKIEQQKKLSSGVTVKKVIGVNTMVTMVKNHIDNEYRTAPLSVIYGVGIDDIRANLQWYKDMTQGRKYDCVTKEFSSMDSAIRHIEKENLEADLRENVIDLWEEIENKFRKDRKKKVRF